MIGDLLIVHVHDTDPQKSDSTELRWVLNVYVPLYFELRKITTNRSVRIDNSGRYELETIFAGLASRIGNLFDGWTEVGDVATTWTTAVWSEEIEHRWF